MTWRFLGWMLTLSACLLVTGGCFQQVVLRQGVRGTVVDASTMTPIIGAMVRIQQPLGGGNGRYYSNRATAVCEVMTTSDGTFSAKPVKGWQFYPLIIPVDRAAGSCLLTIDGIAHTSFTEVFMIHDDPSTHDIGTIKLVERPATADLAQKP